MSRGRGGDGGLRSPDGYGISFASDTVVLFNTGSGLKYIDAIADAMRLKRPGVKQYPKRTPVGGVITPA